MRPFPFWLVVILIWNLQRLRYSDDTPFCGVKPLAYCVRTAMVLGPGQLTDPQPEPFPVSEQLAQPLIASCPLACVQVELIIIV